jgi:hypothetical protein
VASTTLVDQYIDDGRRLVDALEQSSFPLNAALWYYLPESDQWRLLLVSTLVDDIGPRATYSRIQQIIHDRELMFASHLGLDDITVAGPDDDIVKALPPVVALHGTQNRSNDQEARREFVVDDAYVYRFEPPPGGSHRSSWPITLEDVIKKGVRDSLVTLFGPDYPSKIKSDVDVLSAPSISIRLQRLDTGQTATRTINPFLPETIFGEGLRFAVDKAVRELASELHR